MSQSNGRWLVLEVNRDISDRKRVEAVRRPGVVPPDGCTTRRDPCLEVVGEQVVFRAGADESAFAEGQASVLEHHRGVEAIARRTHGALRERDDVIFAGQLTGVEGYTESAASGILAGINLDRVVRGLDPAARYETRGPAEGPPRRMGRTSVVAKPAGVWRIRAIRNMLPAPPATPTRTP